MIPDWKNRKPSCNNGKLPVLIVDCKVMPKIAEGIWHAQKAGWESILTYDYVLNTQERNKQRRKKRSYIGKDGFQRCGLTADEYPFACTKENTGSTFLSHASQEEQSSQGGQLNAFFLAHGAYSKFDSPFYFEVKVINYR